MTNKAKETAKHTPGPLQVVIGSACEEAPGNGWTVAEERDGGEVIATHYRTAADAILGAAAPDLLEAAKDALDWLDPDCKLDGAQDNDDRSEKESRIIRLYAAIAKATK